MAARTPSADDILGGDLSAGDIEGGGGKHVIYSVKSGSEEHPLGVADEVTASSSRSGEHAVVRVGNVPSTEVEPLVPIAPDGDSLACGVCSAPVLIFAKGHPRFSDVGVVPEWNCDVCGEDMGASDRVAMFGCPAFDDCDWSACAGCVATMGSVGHNTGTGKKPVQEASSTGGQEQGWVAALAGKWPAARTILGKYDWKEDKTALVTVQVLLLLCAGAILAGDSWGASWAVMGVLGILTLLFCCLGLYETWEKLSMGASNRVALFPLLLALGFLLLPAAHAALMLAVGGWAGALTAGGLVALLVALLVSSALFKNEKGEWDPGHVVAASCALYGAALTAVPAALFTFTDYRDGTGAPLVALGAAGVFVFVFPLWSLGWAFLWFRGGAMEPINQTQHMSGMPPYLLLRLKLLTVASECYNYCGFSFFPALPWKAMVVPPKVPHPQAVMLAGFFDFGTGTVQRWTFFSSAAMVVLSFVLLGLTRKNLARQLLVIQIFFDLLSFPLLKKLSSVFSCTSAAVYMEDEDAANGTMALFCDGHIPPDAQCLDHDPSMQCWGDDHRVYIAAVMVLLLPYYAATLHLQASAQARQSVVKIDGGWTVVSGQFKFMLAIIASSFGGCYPIVMVVSVEVAVLTQLLMLRAGTIYSNVHSLNAVRLGGLLTAAVNGMYAAFVLWYFRNDPAGASPCSRTPGIAAAVGSGSGSESLDMAARLVSDYSTFFGLLAANATTIGLGVVWFHTQGKNWVHPEGATGFPSLASINSAESAKEADYPTVKLRLDETKRLLTRVKIITATANEICERKKTTVPSEQAGLNRELYALKAEYQQITGDPWPGTAEQSESSESASGVSFVFDLRVAEPILSEKTGARAGGYGQELEPATFEMVMSCAELAAPNGVRLMEVNGSLPSGLMVGKALTKLANPKLTKLAKLKLKEEHTPAVRARIANDFHEDRFICSSLSKWLD